LRGFFISAKTECNQNGVALSRIVGRKMGGGVKIRRDPFWVLFCTSNSSDTSNSAPTGVNCTQIPGGNLDGFEGSRALDLKGFEVCVRGELQAGA
jgi:hypothetical protein